MTGTNEKGSTGRTTTQTNDDVKNYKLQKSVFMVNCEKLLSVLQPKNANSD